MPLVHSKSEKAFGENVRREMKAGKPQKQAVAIAYSVRKAAGGKGNFEPTGNDQDGFNGLGQTLQDHNPDGPKQPAAIGSYSGSRSGWKRAD